MVVKLGTACCLHLSPPLGAYSPLFTPLSPSRRCRPASPLVCVGDRTAFLGSGAAKLFRSRSVGDAPVIRRTSSSASSLSSCEGGFFGDDDSEDGSEFAERIRELAVRMEEESGGVGGREVDEEEEEEEDVSGEMVAAAFSSPDTTDDDTSSSAGRPRTLESAVDVAPPKWAAVPRMPSDWQSSMGGGAMVPGSSGLPEPSRSPGKRPLHQHQSQPHRWDSPAAAAAAAPTAPAVGGDDGTTSGCSVKRALSSVVFIIRELHSHTLQLRELVFREGVQADWVLGKVQAEVHASFCWLFQQIFSCTPTLMVSVMLLLANFTVHSMAAGGAVAAAAAAAMPSSAVQAPVVSVEYNVDNMQEADQQEEDEEIVARKSNGLGGRGPSSMKALSFGKPLPAVSGDKDGGGGGGRTSRPVAGATDDSNSWGQSRGRYLGEEEARAWRRIQDEAARMQSETRPEPLTDPDTLRHLVAPVSVPDLDSSSSASSSSSSSPDVPVAEYMRTELEYRMALEASPDNPLLLGNYAQFLFLVARDHDRAEHYFKRAAAVRPPDAESLARYADFLWLARNDLCAAEEAYLEAIEADPGNTCHAASYAHFLWNTGGEDTCFPLGGGGGQGQQVDYCDHDDDGDGGD